ncbi:MAG TPA: amidohydrolase [Pseudomonadales bacterium]|nr:amidohydrolase [Pseudomonadales bacterium]
MRDLTVTLIQAATSWHDPAANRDLFDARIGALADPGDLIALPEMFATGFTMDAEGQAETMDGATVSWLRQKARDLGAAIAGSLVIRDGGAVYNRFLCALPDGELVQYDKRHLFRMAGEHEHYAAGAERLVFEFRDWRICPQVCYDLRFPAFMRNVAPGDAGPAYDLLLVVANWPARRAAHWRTLVAARAIENLACVAAVNVVGTDGNDVAYDGDSGVWDAQGRMLAAAGPVAQDLRVRLSAADLERWRRAFPAWLDADRIDLR